MTLFADLGRALGQLGDPRFRRVLWRAVLVVLAAYLAIFVALGWALGALLPPTVALPWLGEVGFLDDLLSWGGIGLALVGSIFLMPAATAAAAGFFLDDVAAAVEARHYPALPPAQAPGLAAQARDAARFLGLMLATNLGALALAVFAGPFAPLVFWAATGFLLGREYFALVAARRLAPAAAERLRRANAGRIWLAGAAMAAPLSLPLVNIVIPIVGVAVFTHQFHRMAGDAAFRG